MECVCPRKHSGLCGRWACRLICVYVDGSCENVFGLCVCTYVNGVSEGMLCRLCSAHVNGV